MRTYDRVSILVTFGIVLSFFVYLLFNIDRFVVKPDVNISPSSIPVPAPVQEQLFDPTKTFAELAYYAELNGGYDCVVVLRDVARHELVALRYRNYVKNKVMPEAVAHVSMHAGAIASAARRLDGKYLVRPSELCKASFVFEPIQ